MPMTAKPRIASSETSRSRTVEITLCAETAVGRGSATGSRLLLVSTNLIGMPLRADRRATRERREAAQWRIAPSISLALSGSVVRAHRTIARTCLTKEYLRGTKADHNVYAQFEMQSQRIGFSAVGSDLKREGDLCCHCWASVPVMTAAIGLPLIVHKFGGGPGIMGAI